MLLQTNEYTDIKVTFASFKMYLYQACFLGPESSEILEGWGIEGYFYCIQVLPKAYEGPRREAAINYTMFEKRHCAILSSQILPAEEEQKRYFHFVQPQIQGSIHELWFVNIILCKRFLTRGNFASHGSFTMSRDIFDCHNSGVRVGDGRRILLASSGWKPVMLLNILRSTG